MTQRVSSRARVQSQVCMAPNSKILTTPSYTKDTKDWTRHRYEVLLTQCEGLLLSHRRFLSKSPLTWSAPPRTPWLSCSLCLLALLAPHQNSRVTKSSPALATFVFLRGLWRSMPKPKRWVVKTWAIRSFGEKFRNGRGLLAALNSCSSFPWIELWLLYDFHQELTLLCWQEIVSPWAQCAGFLSAQQLGEKSIMSLVSCEQNRSMPILL